MKIDSYLYYNEKFNENFINTFKAAYNSIKRPQKNEVLYYCDVIYRKWYYSAIFGKNVLSPSNMFSRLKQKYEDNSIIYANRIQPVSLKSYRGFKTEIIKYTIDNHPIVDDIKKFLDFYYPKIIIDSDGKFVDFDEKILYKLSIFDNLYQQFIFEIVCKIGLVKKMSSIHSSVYSINSNYKEFLKQPKDKILDIVINACIDIAYVKINEMFPDNICLIDKSFIKQALITPMSIDKILSDIYLKINIDIEQIWNTDTKDLSDEEHMIMSSTYYMGIMIDRWLITTFGHYLKLIQPLYLFPVNMKKEINNIYDTIMLNISTDLITSVYNPYSHYYMTPLGSKVFNSVKSTDSYWDTLEKVPIETIFRITLSYINERLEQNELMKEDKFIVYSLRITDIKNKKYWKVLEIQAGKTLHNLHEIISSIFYTDIYCNYSFYMDMDKNPFTAYTSTLNEKRKSKKTETTKLAELNLKEKQTILYDSEEIFMENVKTQKYEFKVEVIKIKYNNESFEYPRISRISKYAKEKDIEQILKENL